MDLRTIGTLAGAVAAIAAWPAAADLKPHLDVNEPVIAPWIEMAEVCETALVTEQHTALSRYGAGPHTFNVKGLPETSVRHPEGVIASAARQGQDVFLCVVRGDPATGPDAGHTLQAEWRDMVRRKLAAQAYVPTEIDNDLHVNPALVRCLDNGELVALFGYFTEASGSFQIAATDTLPGDTHSPCTAEEAG